MLRYLHHHEIDFAQWDACLHKAPNGLIYGLSWYLNIVSPGWDALVKEEAGKYVAVMPLPVARKFGIAYLRQPLLTQQLGVFYTDPLSDSDWAEIAEILKSSFRVISRYAFNTANQEVFSGELPDFSIQEFATYHLDLSQTYPQIFAGYKRSRKWRVNQAKANHLTVQPVQNLALLFEMFDQNTAARIYGFKGEGYTYELLKALYSKAKATATGEIYEVVNSDGDVLAMAFFTFFRNKIIYLFSSTTTAGKKAGAIPFLLDWMIEKHACSGFTFDFEAPRPDGPGAASIIDFYKSFGSEKKVFPAISFENLPPILQIAKAVRKNICRFIKK